MVTRKFISAALILSIALSSSVIAAEGDTYDFSWLDTDKEVFVLQNRKYRKVGKMFFSLGGGITTSGAFVDSNVVQLRSGYFVKEAVGFEYVYSFAKGKENTVAKDVRNLGAAGSIPFRRIVENYMGGMLVWTPFYGKVNTFNKIIYTDWTFGIGYAAIKEKNNRKEVLAIGPPSTRTKPEVNSHGGLMWNFGVKIYFSEMFDIRTDLTTIHYRAKKPSASDNAKKLTYSNWDVTIALGMRF